MKNDKFEALLEKQNDSHVKIEDTTKSKLKNATQTKKENEQRTEKRREEKRKLIQGMGGKLKMIKIKMALFI